jgi:polyisoprenoid-binding protein YceI
MKAILWTIALAGLMPAPGAAADFVLHAGAPNLVVFSSSAPMEKFEGRTRQIEGRIAVDPGALGDSVSVHFEVDLASLDTGLAKRDQHMRETHLETAKYPRAIFDGASLVHAAGVSLAAGRPVTFDSDGTFSLHGVSRRIRVHVEASIQAAGAGSAIHFIATFPVSLADYQISRPEFLFLKLAEIQDVRVEGTAIATP